MKSLSPLRMLLVSSLIIAGCAQEPPPRARVIGGPEIGEPTGGMVVDDGFDIPPADLGRGERPCRVMITLKGVYYTGDDIGRDWRFTVSVNNQAWTSDWLVMRPGTWTPIEETVFVSTGKNSCGLTQLLFFVVRARERGFPFPGSTGMASDTTGIPCSEQMSRRRFIMTVLVREGFRRRTARLQFVFEITSVCLTP